MRLRPAILLALVAGLCGCVTPPAPPSAAPDISAETLQRVTRTLSSDGSWKYINVRRLFIFVERSIDEGTQWAVFEPNDEKTWARVRQSITNFLTTVWRSGALFGGKADEAFFVRCDRTTMTQDDIDNGRLICVIGIAPVKPAEFVIFRIQQKLVDQTQP